MLDQRVIDEAAIRPLIEAFYARVRGDDLLGPIFGAAVHDWNDHHGRLSDFWSSVMLTSGRYKGNPVALHLLHAEAMTADRFARWLSLWRDTTNERLAPAVAAALQAKAERIAESLQLAVQYRRPSQAA